MSLCRDESHMLELDFLSKRGDILNTETSMRDVPVEDRIITSPLQYCKSLRVSVHCFNDQADVCVMCTNVFYNIYWK